MSHSQVLDDESDVFTTGHTALTPTVSPRPSGDLSDFPNQVPWPGNTYIIYEKGTRRAITITDKGLCVAPVTDEAIDHQRWFCVEKQGFFGLMNTKTGKFIGHDNHSSMCAVAKVLDKREYLTPRRHPLGGYQLLSPHWITLRVVSVKDDGRGLRWAEYGETLWEFEQV